MPRAGVRNPKLKEAAAWLFAQQQRARLELEGREAPPPDVSACRACGGGKDRAACAACGGTGLEDRSPPWHRFLGQERLPEELARSVGEIVAAYLAIEHYGVEGWLALDPDARDHGPAPDLMEHLAVLRGELGRLTHEEECRREAARRAAEAAAASRRR